jgi:hypothetical protein
MVPRVGWISAGGIADLFGLRSLSKQHLPFGEGFAADSLNCKTRIYDSTRLRESLFRERSPGNSAACFLRHPCRLSEADGCGLCRPSWDESLSLFIVKNPLSPVKHAAGSNSLNVQRLNAAGTLLLTISRELFYSDSSLNRWSRLSTLPRKSRLSRRMG